MGTAQMAELFQRDCSVITKHIKNVFEEGDREKAMCKFCTLQFWANLRSAEGRKFEIFEFSGVRRQGLGGLGLWHSRSYDKICYPAQF